MTRSDVRGLSANGLCTGSIGEWRLVGDDSWVTSEYIGKSLNRFDLFIR